MRTPTLSAMSLALALGLGTVLTAPATQAQGQVQAFHVPTTAEEHLTLAREYDEQAVSARKEADRHRQMFESYRARAATSAKSPQANPWVVKMQKHCEQLSRDAEKLAADAQQAAAFHRMRAKELSGG